NMVNTLFGDEIISSTELKNNQKKWFDRALKAPISITNTGGRQFVLINREQVRNFVLARDYLELILKYCKEMSHGLEIGKFVSEAFPWAKHLEEHDRLVFANELISALNEVVHTNNWSELEEIIGSWQATAEALTNSKFMEVVNSERGKREYQEVE
ncbi:MAG: hypothetical protein HY665_06975, partial [Chloroflexi bacterium]|nr:hypothetical protein [Chloroflexota bacterium]